MYGTVITCRNMQLALVFSLAGVKYLECAIAIRSCTIFTRQLQPGTPGSGFQGSPNVCHPASVSVSACHKSSCQMYHIKLYFGS